MAQVVVEMSGDEAKLFRAYQKIIDQAAKLEGKQKDLAKTAQQAGVQAEQSFGQQAVTGLTKFAAGIATMQTVTRLFGDAMAYSKANTDAAIASVEKLIATRQQLNQVSATGQQGQQFNDFADRLSMRGISRDDAQRIVFGAQSAGFQGSEDAVARLIGANQFSAQSAINAAGRVREMFGDKSMSSLSALAGVREGARLANIDIDPFMQMLPHLASAESITGGSPAEAMGILSYASSKSDRAAEYIATMSGQLNQQRGFKGIGIMGQVKKLMDMPEAQRQRVLGASKEANQAYDWLSKGFGEVQNRVAGISGYMASPNAFVSQMENINFDPSTEQGRLNMARRQYIVAQNQLEMGRERRLAEGGYQRQATVSQLNEQNESGGAGWYGRFASNKAMEWSAESGLPPWAIRMANDASKMIPLSVLEQAAGKLSAAADNLLRGTDASARQRASANQQPE